MLFINSNPSPLSTNYCRKLVSCQWPTTDSIILPQDRRNVFCDIKQNIPAEQISVIENQVAACGTLKKRNSRRQ